MTIKTFLQKAAAWLGQEEKAVVAELQHIIHHNEESNMADQTNQAAAAAPVVDQVAAGIQIALLLKALDSTLSNDAVSVATQAALAAAYPVAATA